MRTRLTLLHPILASLSQFWEIGMPYLPGLEGEGSLCVSPRVPLLSELRGCVIPSSSTRWKKHCNRCFDAWHPVSMSCVYLISESIRSMKIFRHTYRLKALGAVGILLSTGIVGMGLPAIAQSFLRLRLPNISAPGNRESGSTRSTTCIAPRDNLVSLVPKTNYGQTEKGYPSFYFYLPPTEASQLKLVILNDATNEFVYEGRFSIQGQAGIANVSLPNNGLQQPLEVDQRYVWYLAVICDENDPSADVVVEGYIERVASVTATEEALASELPAIYAEAGLWYDAVVASADLKADGISSEWNALLEAVDLGALTTAPLIRQFEVQEQSTASESL